MTSGWVRAHYIPDDVGRDAAEEGCVVICSEGGGSFLDLGFRWVGHVWRLALYLEVQVMGVDLVLYDVLYH